MRSHPRWLAARLPLVLIVAFAAAGAGIGAQDARPAGPRGASGVPRTPDGRPDMQGTWTNATITALERPVALGDKRVFTEEEAQALEAQAAGRQASADTAESRQQASARGDVGTYNQFWFDSGTTLLPTRGAFRRHG